MAGIQVMFLSCSLLILLSNFLPSAESAPQSDLLGTLPADDSAFLCSLDPSSCTENKMETSGTLPADDSAFLCSLDPSSCRRMQTPGSWGPWSDWSTCSSSCGSSGQERRTRICPSSVLGGQGCEGSNAQSRSCTNLTPCPKNGPESCQCVSFSRCLDNQPATGGGDTIDGAPDLTSIDGIGIRTRPDQGGSGGGRGRREETNHGVRVGREASYRAGRSKRSNILIDIGDRTISQCDNALDICCVNVAPEGNPTPPPPLPVNPPGQCGIRNTNGVGVTITGFTEGQAQLSEFPWMVAVLGSDNTYVGGGSLVHSRIVLTAAHKVNGFTGQIVARIGDWDLSQTSEPIPSQQINVQKVLYHPNFNPKTLVYDAALLILEADAVLGDTVMPVCLPEVDQVFDGASCFVTGWGKDVFGRTGRYQAIMKKVSVPAISHGQCQNMLRNTRLGPTFSLHDTFNCAGGQGEDACEGDGGSPLVCPNSNNNDQYVQMGVVAWGIGCGQVGNPGVYGSIPKTVQWIRNAIQQEVGFDIRTSLQKDGRGK